MSKRTPYVAVGDRKPHCFKVGDLFTYRNGETALVTEVFDRYEGRSKYGPEWTLRLLWTPGNNGDTMNRHATDGTRHGVLAMNISNQLNCRAGRHFFPAKE